MAPLYEVTEFFIVEMVQKGAMHPTRSRATSNRAEEHTARSDGFEIWNKFENSEPREGQKGTLFCSRFTITGAKEKELRHSDVEVALFKTLEFWSGFRAICCGIGMKCHILGNLVYICFLLFFVLVFGVEMEHGSLE